MNKIIEEAIDRTQKEIKRFPNKILSESDFERMLAKHLENVLLENDGDFSVHTQVSYYDVKGKQNNPKYRVDILLMKEADALHCKQLNKSFMYSDTSYPIEVKYLHKQNTLKGVFCDFNKAYSLLNIKGNMYVVVLFDKKNPQKDKNIEKKYKEVLAGLNESQKRLKYRLLYKEE